MANQPKSNPLFGEKFMQNPDLLQEKWDQLLAKGEAYGNALALINRETGQTAINEINSGGAGPIQAINLTLSKITEMKDNNRIDDPQIADEFLEILINLRDKLADTRKKKTREDQEKKSKIGPPKPETIFEKYSKLHGEIHTIEQYLALQLNPRWEREVQARYAKFISALDGKKNKGPEHKKWIQGISEPGDQRERFGIIARFPKVEQQRIFAKNRGWI